MAKKKIKGVAVTYQKAYAFEVVIDGFKSTTFSWVDAIAPLSRSASREIQIRRGLNAEDGDLCSWARPHNGEMVARGVVVLLLDCNGRPKVRISMTARPVAGSYYLSPLDNSSDEVVTESLALAVEAVEMEKV